MSVAAAMGGHGAPVTIEWDGKTVEIKNPDWGKVISQMTNFMIDHDLDLQMIAWNKLVDRGLWQPQQRDAEAIKFVVEAEDSGAYSINGPKFRALLETAFEEADEEAKSKRTPEEQQQAEAKAAKHLPTLLKFISLMAGIAPEDVLAVMKDKRAEFLAKIVLVMKRSFPPKEQGATQIQETLAGPPPRPAGPARSTAAA